MFETGGGRNWSEERGGEVQLEDVQDREVEDCTRPRLQGPPLLYL